MLNGTYLSENEESVFGRYTIKLSVKETEKSYTMNLIEFNSRYGATQIEDLFRNKNKIILRKDKGGHAIRIWGDNDFTFYPYQAGIPFYFRKIESEDKQ